MRMMSIQALAMQRIRDSVTTLSRETGFRERSVEQFSQVPLYIPEYQRWSKTLQSIVGTPPPTLPEFKPSPSYTRYDYDSTRLTAEATIKAGRHAEQARLYHEYGQRYPQLAPWGKYLDEYIRWQTSQRTLPV